MLRINISDLRANKNLKFGNVRKEHFPYSLVKFIQLDHLLKRCIFKFVLFCLKRQKVATYAVVAYLREFFQCEVFVFEF